MPARKTAHALPAAPPPQTSTIVRTFGFTLMVPLDAQADLLPVLRSLVCYHLNLCASVGCSCTSPDAPDRLCYESEAGRTRKVIHSEGPTWAVIIKALDTHVLIEIHTTAEMVPIETRSLYKELSTYNYPIFVHGVTRL